MTGASVRPVSMTRLDDPAGVPVNARSAEIGPILVPSRTVPIRRSALLRDVRQLSPLTDSDVSVSLRSLGGRDLAILASLHHYRYLDASQIEQLFFSDGRYRRRRLKKLVDLRLVHRWGRVSIGDRIPQHAIHLLSRQGAIILASHLGQPKDAFIRRSDEAWEKCFHVDHDLEANQFFINLAKASALIPFEGLYHWVGEATARTVYRQRRAYMLPDGWGRFLLEASEVTFFLEWDRNTESSHRLAKKLGVYSTFFTNRESAARANVLLVAPTGTRESSIRSVALDCMQGSTCSIWITNAPLLAAIGPLGAAWITPDGEHRLSLREMPAWPRSDRPVSDCIGKQQWWLRRPGGGEVA